MRSRDGGQPGQQIQSVHSGARVPALGALAIQSGEPGTSDTTHRIQTAHFVLAGQPQVFSSEHPEFGLHGRGGRLYSLQGIGQSLLLLSADILVTAIEAAL